MTADEMALEIERLTDENAALRYELLLVRVVLAKLTKLVAVYQTISPN